MIKCILYGVHFFMSEKKLDKSAITIFVLYTLAQITFSMAKIGGISPFLPALFYATAFFKERNFLYSLVFLCVTFFTQDASFGFYSAFASAPLIACVEIKIRPKIKRNLILASCLFHLVITLVTATGIALAQRGLACVVCVCFSYVFYLAIKFLPLLNYRVKLSDTEYVCISLSTIAVAMGFSSIFIDTVPIVYGVCAFCSLFCAWVWGRGSALSCAVCFGIGYAFVNNDVSACVLFVFCALFCSFFTSSHRIFSMLSYVMAHVVFRLFFVPFEDFTIEIVISVIFQVLFLCVPQKKINALKNSRHAKDGSVAVRYLVNKNRNDLAKKIKNLKEIFEREGEILSSLYSDNKKSAYRLALTCKEDYCSKCENFSKCVKNGLDEALTVLSRLTLIKNKAVISSLPPLLQNDCVHLASLVGYVHAQSLQIRRQMVEKSSQNKLKSSLAQSLKGVGEILEKQEDLIALPLSFDFENEEKIKDELSFRNVFCSQALVVGEEKKSVTLLIKRETYDKEEVENGVSAVLGDRFKVERDDESVIKGWLVINLSLEPLFTALVGVSSKPKTEGATGDTHSFISLGFGKYLCALCDGMGSGESAGIVSEKAITLIEGFYKAGFDHALTIKSVNSFLKIDADETFSALDVMIFDANEGRVDVIKMASPPCYIKKDNRVIRVDSSSLPLGIVGEISPSITSREVEDGDCFVFVSDGIADCFDGDELSAFVNNEDDRNPQLLCERILQEAKSRNKSGKEDDMTVIALKVLARNYG